jgi:hypothetical protein
MRAPFKRMSTTRSLSLTHHVKHFDRTIRGTSCKSFTVIVELSIMLQMLNILFKYNNISKRQVLRTIISSWAVSIGTESDTVADACKQFYSLFTRPPSIFEKKELAILLLQRV